MYVVILVCTYNIVLVKFEIKTKITHVPRESIYSKVSYKVVQFKLATMLSLSTRDRLDIDQWK